MMCDSLTPSLNVSLLDFTSLFIVQKLLFLFFPALNTNSTAFSLTDTSAAGILLFGNNKKMTFLTLCYHLTLINTKNLITCMSPRPALAP